MPPVLRLSVLVATIALADSVNPATVGPALYLATVPNPRRRIGEFAAAFFAVNLVGGALLVLGPGQVLLSLVPRPSPVTKHLVEVVAGALLILLAGVLAIGRARFGAAELPTSRLEGGRAWAAGGGLAALELPTALPYLAAIAAIVGSGRALPAQLALVGLFNIVFMLPVVGILAAVTLAGPGTRSRLERAGERLRVRWPMVFATLALVAGVALLTFGLLGLALG
jgi:cytochrome c biogenesis protein CcdA